MLKRTSNTIVATGRRGENGAVITGQSLAKRPRTVRERAKIGAQWVTGGVHLQPTVVMAADVCECSVAIVADEIRKIEATNGVKPYVDTLWATLDHNQRIAFVERHQDEVWAALEFITR
jgi:hypothetical protein